MASPRQTRRPCPEGASRLPTHAIQDPGQRVRRQTLETEKTKPLGARSHQFRQKLRPPASGRFLAATAQHGGRCDATIDPGIERIEPGQALVDTGQRLGRRSAQGDAIEHEVDEERKTSLLARLTQRPDQNGRSAGRSEIGDRTVVVDYKKGIAAGPQIKHGTNADVIETRAHGSAGDLIKRSGIVQAPRIDVQHLDRAPLHGGRHDRPRHRTLPHEEGNTPPGTWFHQTGNTRQPRARLP